MLAAALFDSSFFNSCKSTSGTETCEILQIKIKIKIKKHLLHKNIYMEGHLRHLDLQNITIYKDKQHLLKKNVSVEKHFQKA